MAEFGLEFDTKSGRKFRLDAIQPVVYLGSVAMTAAGTYTYTYPEFAGVGTVYASCDMIFSSNGPNPKASYYTVRNPASGQVSIVIKHGGTIQARFSIFGRFT